ncbi:hypothetical protein K458DRAFT_57001 [Lentithecium fluviatile CBS 122367]|uniref:Rhodopsin domain-containing protein n=1 Tax=Lentithecium fluviatile CBS 122367 TaxID=1168545 RepID=A0A6G1IVN6_9PLEO|nr:hypothetical protein K458DRAFT_57001 [Lentithecium fluviatile CBS 122367]
MATGYLGALPPPPGVEPNFDDPPSQLSANIALHTVCLTAATLAVAIRLYTRTIVTKNKLGIDDFLCLFSYALTITFSGLMITCYQWGIGRHMWDVPALWIPGALKYFTIAQYIFQGLSCAIKLTFLFFFHRVFWAQTKLAYFIYFGVVFVVCSNAGLLFATIFSCSPVARAWNPMLPGHCVSPKILPYLSGGLNLATDLYIFALPMRPLWQLNMQLERKMKLVAVFGLGSFACIAGLVRLAKTPVLYSSLDASWNISEIAIWAVIEVNIGIICASSTTFPAFVDRHCPKAIRGPLARLWSYATSRKTTPTGSAKTTSGQCAAGPAPAQTWAPHDFVELSDADGASARKTISKGSDRVYEEQHA